MTEHGTVAVDGFTLDIERGTGLSTYARTLQSALGGLGWETAVLYGRNMGRTMKVGTVPGEVALFDIPPRSRLVRLTAMVPKGISPLESRRPLTPVEVGLEGIVDTRPLRSRLRAKRFFNVRNLYVRAYNHFSLYKKFLSVQLPPDIKVMHWTNPFPIRAEGIPNIYTVHDLIPLRLPYTTADRIEYFYSMVEQVAATADRILAVSWTTYRDILSIFPAAADKTRVAYEAVPPLAPDAMGWTDPESVARAIKGEYGLDPEGYFLFVGAIEPKKNIERLLEAYLASGSSRPLLMVGSDGWYSDSVRADIKSLWERGRREYVGPGRVVRLRYVSGRRLDLLLKGARAVLFPSLYEGFGLPILEAMSRDTAVLTSSIGSTAEVAGDAAVLVDPYSVPEISAGIHALDTRDELVADLRVKARERTEYFSLDNYAKRLGRLYGEVFPG